ncbi:MAG: hypothetical protein KJ626_03465 [Verrucomicrobia bacterium]|nr:hypothetical protein [Verrucomicrobiota bacterium]
MKSSATRALLVTVIVLCVIAVPVLAYENLDEFASARATNINADLQANYYMADLDDLEAWYVDQQASWMEVPLPGTDTWTQGSSPSHVPVDWSGLGSTFTSQLVPDPQYGVNVYPLTIKENFSSHQVEFWVGASLIHTMPFRSGYDWTMYTPPGGDTNMYNPARIVIAATLVKDNEMYTYLYNEGFEVGAVLAEAGGENEDLEDTDGDGYSNRDEIAYGTDPYDPGDLPSITGITRTGSGVEVEWAAPTNRWYQIQSITAPNDLVTGTFANEGSQRMGNGTTLVHTDTTSADNKFYRYKAEEADVNGNGLPDWWEYKYWGMLTTNSLHGDEVDQDGLDNSEELYFGYSPLVSERDLIHSIYHTVVVESGTPTQDSGEERFDFHGGGRPLSLADGSAEEAWSGSQATLYGRVNSDTNFLTFHSGGAFFNNDEDNLYIGIYGMERETDNGWVVFIDSNTNGVTTLWHLSGQPKAIGIATNMLFDASEFTPNAALILGANDADGKNFPAYSIAGNELGQGVYDLATGNNLDGFNSTTGGCFISQWSQGASEDSPNGGVEVAISLSALDCAPGDTIKIAAILVGGTDGSARWVSPLVYGKSVSFTGGGMDPVTIIGAPVQLADAGQTLPNVSYPGFSSDDVLLQGFYWNVDEGDWYNIYQTYSLHDIIADAGFTMVWMPPAYKGSNAKSSSGYDTLDHYDVGQYLQAGGTFTPSIPTRYGLRSELEWLIGALQSNGLYVIEDIILNHMVGGQNSGFTYTNYPAHTDAPQFYKTALDFHASTNGHDDNMFPYHNDFGFSFPPNQSYSVDIDHLVPNMRLGLKAWGGWLSGTLGFQGWRLDLAEGVEPWYVWEWLHYVAMRDGFTFMEYWELSNGREMQEWLDLTGRKAAIYDSNLRELFKHMCEDGDNFDMRDLVAPSLLGLEPEYTIVYIDNHDTFRSNDSFDTNGIPTKVGIQEDKPLAYAYAFHSQGLPMVFWREYFDQPYVTLWWMAVCAV